MQRKEMTLKELQSESLAILKDVHTFCVEHGIKYSVAYGTLIGAIRHKGFIPWDDDVDIIMPREHYARFCNEYKSHSYKFECQENSDSCYLAFGRVYDDLRTEAETVVPWHKGSNGVWIDVFPADFVTDDFMEFMSNKKRLQRQWRATVWGREALKGFDINYSALFNIKLLVKKIITINGRVAKSQINRLIKNTQAISRHNSSHWSQLACLDGYEWHRSEDFSRTLLMPFEDMEVMVMNGYDMVLRECYGDYMQLPPEEQRVGHSDGFTKFYWK